MLRSSEAEGARRAYVILDAVAGDLPGVADALAELEQEPVEVTTHVKTPGEPTSQEVDALSAALAEGEADIVVAIGGGSVIDLAKGARLALSAGVPYLTVAADLDLAASAPVLPLVAIPTTAGSGSEVSGGIVIADEETHTKTGIAAPFVRAQHALVDPALTYGAPATVTSWGGIDALAQAIAAMVTDSRKPIGTGIALEAIHLAARALPTVVADGENRAARQEMACASLMAGLAMNISDCGSEHSLAMALGGRHGLPHGLTVGLVLAESMDVDRRARRSCSSGSPTPSVSRATARTTGLARCGACRGSCSRSTSRCSAPSTSTSRTSTSWRLPRSATTSSRSRPWTWTADDAADVYRRALSLAGRSI